MPSRAVIWFRRDLRTADHPALLEGRTSAPTGAPSCTAPSRPWPGTWGRSGAGSCSARATR
jgi:DNA photolyase